MAKIKKPGENNSLCEQGEQDARHLQTQVSPLDGKVKQYYGMKVSTILNAADPTEYFGQDFLKLGEIIKTLKVLGVVKGDKKLNKKVLRYEDENLKVVKLATRLRKDYEKLYSNLRELVYPKAV